jgi:hypothetical protein
LVIYNPSQISEFDDMFYDVEKVDLEDKPLNDDKMENACTSPFHEDMGTHI